MTTTYFAIALALISAGVGLTATLPNTRTRTTAFAAFVLAAIGATLAGVFPMDFAGPIRTVSGRLHAVGGVLTFPTWALGTLLFSLCLRRLGPSRRSRALLALAVASILMVGVLFASIRVLGFGGYAQRLVFVLLSLWLVLVALDLVRSADPPSRTTSREGYRP